VSEGQPVDRRVASLEGPAALPRRNGELVFAAPWEGRAFGMAVAVNERGEYAWEEFRDRLAACVGSGSASYYESWLEALEAVVVARGLVARDELEARATEFKELRRDPVA
jgi:nitrile hydratase accessory protein